MGKRKKLFLAACLAITFLGVGLACACGEENPNSGEDPNAGVQTPLDMEYKVKFNALGGSSVQAQFVKKGDKASKPANPTREGYDFVEWQLNGNPFDFQTAITNDITLVAKWARRMPEKFLVSFVVDDAAFSSTEVSDGKKAIEPSSIPEKEGYLFDGWLLNNAAFDFETPITENITLVAKWATARTVTFAVNGGTEIEPVVLKEGQSVQMPQTSKVGYYLSEWQVGGVAYDFAAPVMQDITLTAVWKAYGLQANQFGVHAYGWDQTSNAEYFNLSEGDNGEAVISAKFQGDPYNNSSIVLRELYSKEYYQNLIKDGQARLEFNLTVGGANAENVSDLYVFGRALSTYPQTNGVYTIGFELQYIVDNYDTIGTLGQGVKAKSEHLDLMLIAWKITGTEYKPARNYIFTISNITLKAPATFSLDFANANGDLVEKGNTTSLALTTNMGGAPVWTTSNAAVATVENGVVTGVNSGTATITVTLGTYTASKTVMVVGDAFKSNQFAVVATGWNQPSFVNATLNNDNAIEIEAKFQGDQWWYPAVVLRNLESKEYYEKLLANGYTKIEFNLAIGEANAEELYIFGTKLTEFTNTNGVYQVFVNLQHIVDNYATIGNLGTSVEARPSKVKEQMFIMCQATCTPARNYTFTISNANFK